MGRFLGGSPPDSDSGRRGRRYEALPANGADDDHEDRESLGTEEAVTSPLAPSSATAAAATTMTTATSPPASSSTAASASSNSAAAMEREQRGDAAAAAALAVVRSGEQQMQKGKAQEDGKKKGSESGDNQEEEVVAITISDEITLEQKSESPEESAGAGAEATIEDLGPDAIQVRILDLNGKFFNIPCRLDWRVSIMKQKVLESTEVPISAQRLIYRGRVLEDESCLAEYKVEDGHTIHLFVRMNQTPDLEIASADATSSGASSGNGIRLDDGSGMTIVHISNDIVSSAVFPSDSARRVDPLMLDSPLGNCARRVKLWSSFLLIIYTMKVMGQFALLANDQQLRSQQQNEGGTGTETAAEREDQRERMYDYPEYYHQDPVAGVVELLIHAFGVYVGGVGFKAAHDTDIRPIRFFCRGVVWLAILTIAEQIYITIQISNSDIPNERIRFAYGAQAPSKDDIVSANIFQTIMLIIMWIIAIRHAYSHQAEVNAYNQSFAAAAMNAVPPVHLPEVV